MKSPKPSWFTTLLSFFRPPGKQGIPSAAPPSFEATRFPGNPLITFDHSPSLGDNINGPSVIRVPDWVDNPLGRYYLYFAHHLGQFIRLAYADSPEGPWTLHEPGVLHLDEVTPLVHHIASPDAHVDHERQEITLFVHGVAKEQKGQKTVRCTSADGLAFNSGDKLLGRSYFRVWQHERHWYAIANTGVLLRAKDPARPWQRRKDRLFPFITINDEHGLREDVRMRHPAVWHRGDHILVFYTRKQDAPERILCARVDLNGDWRQWTPSHPVEILKPETDYEGSQQAITLSHPGSAIGVEHALRDPAIFVEDDRIYLYYSIAGEQGLAGARLQMTSESSAL